MSNFTRRNFIKAFGASGAALFATACGGNNNSSGSSSSNGAAKKDVLAVCLASEPDVIDPALNSTVDGASMIVHLFSGLARWKKEGDKYKIVPDLAEELTTGVKNEDGTTTYTYKLREGLKWSDGKNLTANDFVYSWNRAASVELGADYGYMFENVKGYDEVTATVETGQVDDKGTPVVQPANPNAKLAVEAPDERTLVVTLSTDVPFWSELLAFPTLFPVREDVVSNESWCTNPSTFISNGAFKMTGWEHNSVITLEKSDTFYAASKISLPKIEFYLSDDANNMLANFRNGTWQLIDDVPTNEIASLKTEFPDEFKIDGQMGTSYISWNMNQEILPADSKLTGAEAEKARAEIRRATALLLDRNYIVDKVAQGGQIPAPSFVSMGLTEPDGSEFCNNAGDSKEYKGYYNVSEDAVKSNFDKALEVLKKYYNVADGKVTNFPTLTYLYNTNEGHKAIAEYIQSAFGAAGIKVELDNQEWNTFLNTRKSGNFSIARNGWVCDYNDPICMLDMWITASGNNDCQFGKGTNAEVAVYDLDLTDLGYDVKVQGGTWAQTYDVLISTIKAESDNTKRFKLMHRAEDMLMNTGAICPLYFYTDMYMISSKVKGAYSIPLGYKFFHEVTIEG